MIDWEKRNVNLDFIRCIAVFSVISVHFFLYGGYYSEPLNNGVMYFATLARTMFIIGVPLFMMLTGYLKNKKTLSKKHYFGIKKTVFIYILATLCAVLYRKYIWGEAISVFGGFLILFSYQ
ncbi:MAG: acyltransferase family protein, partial [Firmicutes bacterium]|nr:acyltransferase family protein [Bacillota bacterium]